MHTSNCLNRRPLFPTASAPAAQASDSSTSFNILSFTLVAVFWVMTIMSFVVLTYLAMIATSGLYVYSVADVAYEVGAACRQGAAIVVTITVTIIYSTPWCKQ